MNLLEAIHGLWAGDWTLLLLLPPARVFTGRIPRGTSMPCARIDQPASSPHARTTDSMIRDTSVSIHVWAATYAAGDAVRLAVEDAFANRTISLADDGRVLDVRVESSGAVQEDDPGEAAWQFVVQLGLRFSRARVH